jgi:hypothetical protein
MKTCGEADFSIICQRQALRLCRGLNVRSVRTWIDWRHCLVHLGLEIGRSADQDGC